MAHGSCQRLAGKSGGRGRPARCPRVAEVERRPLARGFRRSPLRVPALDVGRASRVPARVSPPSLSVRTPIPPPWADSANYANALAGPPHPVSEPKRNSSETRGEGKETETAQRNLPALRRKLSLPASRPRRHSGPRRLLCGRSRCLSSLRSTIFINNFH